MKLRITAFVNKNIIIILNVIILFFYIALPLKSSNPNWMYCLEKNLTVTSCVGDSNYLWLCTKEYKNTFVTHKFDMRTLQIVDSIPIDGDYVKMDSKNNLWVAGYRGFGKYDGKIIEKWDTSNYSQIGFPYSKYSGNRTICIDNFDHIIVGTSELGLVKFDGITCTVFDSENSDFPKTGVVLQTATVSIIESDKDNNIWVYLKYAGLGFYDGVKWKFFNVTNSGLPTNEINSMITDKSGNLWLGTDVGLVKYDNQNWTVYNKENSGLPDEIFNHLQVDKSNNIWASISNVGLVKFDGKDFKIFDKSNSGLSSNVISNIYIDVYDNKWISVGKDNEDYSLNIFNENGIGITSVDETNFSGYLLSPNPASDFITITLPELNKGLQPLVQNVQIFNTLGIEVAQTPSSVIYNSISNDAKTTQTGASELLRINISQLPTGVYFIKIGDKVEKFVKM
jgi:hypothetical protein